MFKLIHSLGNQYEIDELGNFRHIYKKKIYKHHTRYDGKAQVVFHFKGKQTARRVDRLLFEVFGIEFTPKRGLPCSATKDGVTHDFVSLPHCARFLTGKVRYTANTILNYLKEYKPNIDGYEISYHEGE